VERFQSSDVAEPEASELTGLLRRMSHEHVCVAQHTAYDPPRSRESFVRKHVVTDDHARRAAGSMT
jgi:hypothetical protein